MLSRLQKPSQTTEMEAKRWKADVSWVQECLNLVFVHSCSYLNVTTTASFCAFLFFYHEMQTKRTGKMTMEAWGKTQQGAKKVEMSEQSKAVTREDSCLVYKILLWLQKAIPF